MFNKYELKDIGIKVISLLFGLEKRMFKKKSKLILQYKTQNLQLQSCKFLLVGNSHSYGLNDYPFDNKDIVNRAINGDTTKGILYRFSENVSSIKYSTIILEIGYNDFKYRSLQQAIENYKRIVEKITCSNVYIVSLFPVFYKRRIVNKKIKQFNSFLKHLCEERSNYEYIDVFSYLEDNRKGGINEHYVLNDGVHLNSKGYEIYAGLLKKVI